MGVDCAVWRQRIGHFAGGCRNRSQAQVLRTAGSLPQSATLLFFASSIVLTLLLIGGVEPNPGPGSTTGSPENDKDRSIEVTHGEEWLQGLQKRHGCYLPQHVVNILTAFWYDNPTALGALTDDSKIAALETQARTCLDLIIGENESLEKYRGMFKSDSKFKESFIFFGGEREVLKALARYALNEQASKGFLQTGVERSSTKRKSNGSLVKPRSAARSATKTTTTRSNVSAVPGARPRSRSPSVESLSDDSEAIPSSSGIDLHAEEKALLKSAQIIMKELHITFSSDSLAPKVTLGEDNKVEGQLDCPYCSKPVKQGRTKYNKWSASNFKRHIANVHLKKIDDKTADERKEVERGGDSDGNLRWLCCKGRAFFSSKLHKNPEFSWKVSKFYFCERGSFVRVCDLPQERSKWKDPLYSRRMRTQRKLQKLIPGQTSMLRYISVLTHIDKLISENNELRKELAASFDALEDKTLRGLGDCQLLRTLIDSARANSGRKKNGNRYDETLTKFFSYLYSVGGRFTYELLGKNLANVIPSVGVVSKFASRYTSKASEGQFRFAELRNYLTSNNYPLVVWISEDATRITGRIQYDPSSNQVVGFVLPYDNHGLPIKQSFPATNYTQIGSYFEKEKIATNVYTIMAQPVYDKSAAFCLCLYGTDNRFDHEHVMKRWKWMKKEAQKFGIEILGFSSDGDSKLLKAMSSFTFHSEDETPLQFAKYFSACWNTESGPYCLQDFVHIATKIRTLFLKRKKLPMGSKYVVSVTYVEEVMETHSKEEHGLTTTDILPSDKMNFQAVLNICNPRVIRLMTETNPSSIATAAFLEVVDDLIQSFMNPALKPRKRLYLLWRSIFFFRLWRKWLQLENFNLDDNFISLNAYICIEINGHVMLKLMRKLRDSGRPEQFIPWLFSSQPCESFFRLARSMTSTFSTVINFSLLDFIHKVKRIDFQGEIETTLSAKGYFFPRNARKRDLGDRTHERLFCNNLPTDSQIHKILREALFDANSLAVFLNMNVSENFAISTLSHGNVTPDDILNEALVVDVNDEPAELLQTVSEDLDTLANNDIDLTCCATLDDVPIDASFVIYRNSKNVECEVKKSTLCWLMSSQGPKLSSDRLQRVRATTVIPAIFQRSMPKQGTQYHIAIDDVLSRGLWCAFHAIHDDEVVSIGRIVEFEYLSGTAAQRRYTLQSAPVRPARKNERGLGCLCVWYSCTSDGTLEVADQNHEVHDICKYLCTIPAPVSKQCGNFQLEKNILNEIYDKLQNL